MGVGSVASAVRTGQLGLPMALAQLLGPLTHHADTAAVYRDAAAGAGHDPDALPVSINTHGFVGATSQQAREVMYPYFSKGMMDNNHQRGRGFPLSRGAFDAQSSPGAGLIVGSSQEVAEKLLAYHELLGVTRAIVQMGFGGMPQKDHLAAIERLGTEVAPIVRREVEARQVSVV